MILKRWRVRLLYPRETGTLRNNTNTCLVEIERKKPPNSGSTNNCRCISKVPFDIGRDWRNNCRKMGEKRGQLEGNLSSSRQAMGDDKKKATVRRNACFV